MSIVRLRYRVPVYVEVDLRTGEIEQVFVDDEAAELDTPVGDRGNYRAAVESEKGHQVSSKTAQRAVEIAEGMSITITPHDVHEVR